MRARLRAATLALSLSMAAATGCELTPESVWIEGARVCATADRGNRPWNGPATIQLTVENTENGERLDETWTVNFGSDGAGKACFVVHLGEAAGPLGDLQPTFMAARIDGGGLFGERITGPRLARDPKQDLDAYLTGMPEVDVIFDFDESVPTDIYDLGLLGMSLERAPSELGGPADTRLASALAFDRRSPAAPAGRASRSGPRPYGFSHRAI